MVDKHLARLKGIVTKEGIENKCIALDFEEARVEEWVNSL